MHPVLLYKNIEFFKTYARALNFLATDYLPLLHQTFFDAKDQKLMFDSFDKAKEEAQQNEKRALLKKVEEQIVTLLDACAIQRSPEQQLQLLSGLKKISMEQHYAYNALTRNWNTFGPAPKNEPSSWQEDAAYHEVEMEPFLKNISDMKLLIRYYSNRQGGGGGSGPAGILCTAILNDYSKKHNEFHRLQNVGQDKELDIPCDCFKEAIYANLKKEQKKLALTDTFHTAYCAVASTLGQAAVWDVENKIAASFEGKDQLIRLLKWLDKNPGDIKNTTGSHLEGCIEISTNYRGELAKILEIFKEAIPITPRQDEERLQTALSDEKKLIFLAYLQGDRTATDTTRLLFQKLHLGIDLKEKEVKERELMESTLDSSVPSETMCTPADEKEHHKALLLGQLPLWGEIFEKINKIFEREMRHLENA